MLNFFVFILGHNEHLVDINLSWNHLRQKGAFSIANSLLVCI